MQQAKPMINNQNSWKFIKVLFFTFLVLLIAHLTVLVLKFKALNIYFFIQPLKSQWRCCP